MPKSQRERCKNFLEEEKEILLNLVEKHKHIIENKKTDAVWANHKRDTWEKIANKFNSISKTGERNGTQLKLLYEGMKKKARQNIAADKLELYKTGGGSFTSSLSQLDERIVSGNREQFLHKTSAYDSNAGPSNRGTFDALNKDSCNTSNIDTPNKHILCNSSIVDSGNNIENNEIFELGLDAFGEELERDTTHNSTIYEHRPAATICESRSAATLNKTCNQTEKQMRQQKHDAELSVLKASQEKYEAEIQKIRSENAIQLQLLQVLKEKAEIEKELAEFNLKIKKQ